MSSEISVTIKGFKNREEAIQFMSWYEGQGEQDSCEWMECRKDEGLDVRDSLMTKSVDEKNLILTLRED